MNTLEVHTAVDICALLIVGRGQCPNKCVVVLHWWPSHLRKKKSTHSYFAVEYILIWFLWQSLGSQYLEEPYPVIAGPVVLWAQCVVAIDSALREVTAAHVSKLHKASLLHGNTKVRQPVAPTGENTMFKNELTVVFYVICCKFKVETDMHGELTVK